jgi:hypothetical protein
MVRWVFKERLEPQVRLAILAQQGRLVTQEPLAQQVTLERLAQQELLDLQVVRVSQEQQA